MTQKPRSWRWAFGIIHVVGALWGHVLASLRGKFQEIVEVRGQPMKMQAAGFVLSLRGSAAQTQGNKVPLCADCLPKEKKRGNRVERRGGQSWPDKDSGFSLLSSAWLVMYFNVKYCWSRSFVFFNTSSREVRLFFEEDIYTNKLWQKWYFMFTVFMISTITKFQRMFWYEGGVWGRERGGVAAVLQLCDEVLCLLCVAVVTFLFVISTTFSTPTVPSSREISLLFFFHTLTLCLKPKQC